MDPLLAVRRVLAAGSDRENPSAEELADLFERVERIAVIGLSRDPTKAARRVPSYLAAKGYDVVAVNPNAERILGKTAYDLVGQVPEPVELVVIFRPSEVVAGFVEQAAARPDRPAIWLQEGIRADAVVARLRSEGRLVVQDLCTYKVHRALPV